MRRFTLLLSVIIVLLLGGGVFASPPDAIAQEATPAGDEMAIEGVTFELLGIAPGVTAPAPTDLVLVRLGIEPGATLPLEPSDPEGGLLLLQAGTLTLRAETPLTVSRAGDLAATIATAEAGGDFAPLGEPFASGEEITLAVGDVVYVPGNIGGEVRNDGQERAEALVFLLTASAAGMGEATPTPAVTAATVAVTLSEFTIEMPTELPAGPTTFEITNAGAVEHNFEVEGQGIEEELSANLAPGASGALTLDLAPGAYEVYCPVNDHAAEGMRLEVAVTE